MNDKISSITEKQIGDTFYIIESVFNSATKETAFEKLKRMILNEEAKKAS